MTVTDARFQLNLGANLKPTGLPGMTSGAIFQGRVAQLSFPAAGKVIAARLIFGANAQTVTLNVEEATLTPSAVGARQLEIAAVTAPAGATADGTCTLTVTNTGIAGSPLAVPVTLSKHAHKTELAVAQAMAAKLNATPVLSAVFDYDVYQDNISTRLRQRRRFPAADDSFANIAIPAGLGITAAASSSDFAGAAGVVIERVGSDGIDQFGEAMGNLTVCHVLHAQNSVLSLNTVNCSVLGVISPGAEHCLASAPGLNYSATEPVWTSAGKCIVDILYIGR